MAKLHELTKRIASFLVSIKLTSPVTNEDSMSVVTKPTDEELRRIENEKRAEEDEVEDMEIIEESEVTIQSFGSDEESMMMMTRSGNRLGCLQCTGKAFDGLFDSFGKSRVCQDYQNVLEFVLGVTLLFWGIVLEVRGFPALTVMFFFSFIYVQFGNFLFRSSTSAEQVIDQSMAKVKSISESLKQLTQQCTLICFVLCTCTITLWLDGSVGDVLLLYTLCVSAFLISPGYFLQSSNELSKRGWENDIDEFLPAPTEDNLKLLKRAGDNSERSFTPSPGFLDCSTDSLPEDDLSGMKMPSHEEVSTDEEEFSEFELNGADTTETDGNFNCRKKVPAKSFSFGRFSRASSSEDETTGLDLSKFDDEYDDSDDDSASEFEVIDKRELANLKTD